MPRPQIPAIGRGAPLALAAVGAVALLLLPVPSAALDLLLTAQLAAGVVVLWTAATARAPSRLSALPLALMTLTLLRLALNVATTRAILSRGEAGRVVEAFGDAMVGGDLLVGLAVFAVVTIAQYVVVARGAGRVAEVAARFALDALPGRQQAIEAELRAGALDAEGARRRRDALERTSGLYGAMDGVMRFVRGDAIAGVCIVAVDIVGGLAIGIARHGMDPDTALATYTVLTVGDGLASQVPAVLGTAAAAVLAVRLAATDAERGGEAPSNGSVQQPLIGAAVVFGALAWVPGLPGWPLAAVALILALAAARMGRAGGHRSATAEAPRSATGWVLRLDLHPDALAAIDGRTAPVVQQARLLAREYGVLLPPVQCASAPTDVPPSGYRISIGGAPVARGVVLADRVFVCPCPADRSGVAARHPVHDAPGRWVEHGAGLTPPTVVALHLAAAWRRDRAALGLQAVADRLQAIERDRPALVRAVVPRRLTLEALTTVLRRLLAEDLPVHDLASMLEAIAEQPEGWQPERRLATLRRARRPWLAARFARERWLATVHLDLGLEAAFAADALSDETLRDVVERIDAIRAAHPQATLVVADEVRVAVRAVLGELRPGLPVLGQRELEPGLTLRLVGLLGVPC